MELTLLIIILPALILGEIVSSIFGIPFIYATFGTLGAIWLVCHFGKQLKKGKKGEGE